ncbi:MAG: hypothetical protein WC136_01300 [Sphaerochaeta sp.]|jgi:uncharacterized RDD family membrane protein YckC
MKEDTKIKCLTSNSKEFISNRFSDFKENAKSELKLLLLIALVSIGVFIGLFITMIITGLLSQIISMIIYGTLQSWVPITLREMGNFTFTILVILAIVIFIINIINTWRIKIVSIYKYLQFEECEKDQNEIIPK